MFFEGEGFTWLSQAQQTFQIPVLDVFVKGRASLKGHGQGWNILIAFFSGKAINQS